MSTTAPTARSLLLPKEHGSWSLAFEPLALGLLVAPSLPGLALAAAVAAGFFTRRPLKLAATLPDSDPRRQPALAWALRLAVLATAALLVAAALALERNTPQAPGFALWPLLLAAPFGALFLWFDLRNEMREAEAELTGCATFAFVPAACATLAGWPPIHALSLAGVMLARSLPTVLAVRTFLRLGKGETTSPAWPLFAATGSGLALALLASRGYVPRTAPALSLLLLARALLYVTPWRPAWSARRVGVTEAVLGTTYVLALAAAYRL